MGMKSMKGIVMLFKGKITLQKNCFALNLNYRALWHFQEPRKTASGQKIWWQAPTLSYKLKKTLHNIHWENKQKLLDDVHEKAEAAQAAGGEDNDSDEWLAKVYV